MSFRDMLRKGNENEKAYLHPLRDVSVQYEKISHGFPKSAPEKTAGHPKQYQYPLPQLRRAGDKKCSQTSSILYTIRGLVQLFRFFFYF